MSTASEGRAARQAATDAEQRGPAIFRAFPGLEARLPWIRLAALPTPVQPLEHLDPPGLWIKRDDLSSPVYGGNKVRKLEFVLAGALQEGKREVVTMGGIGTNHGLATALYCSRLGLACTLLTFPQPVTPYVLRNLLLMHRHARKLIYVSGYPELGLRFFVLQRVLQPRALFLYAGGSSPLGTLGFVSAALELREQVEQGLLPMPRKVFCAVGSNGTLAGLALGLRLAGMPTEAVGVRVAPERFGPFPITTSGSVASLMGAAYRLLRRLEPSVPHVRLDPPQVLGAHLGTGYGHPTEEGREALALLEEREGIHLDPTYTAKAMAGMLACCRRSHRRGGTHLFWNTFNSVDLRTQCAGLDYRSLPAPYHRFFQTGVSP